MTKTKLFFYTLTLTCLTFFSFTKKDKPTLFLVGDSTVSGGWGRFMHQYLDTNQIYITNRAVSGTSSRSYYTGIIHDQSLAKNGMWAKVMKDIKKGDYVLIQFGHNDDSPVVDTLRARGSLPGIGPDSVLVNNHFSRAKETVHTYGWYLNQMVKEVKKKGAFAVICSPIPMDKWKDGNIIRSDERYGKWSKEAAERANTYFIHLNHLIAEKYDQYGQAKVTSHFTADHVHPTNAGSIFMASIVAEGIRNTKDLKLSQYLK
jgi:rhamnogalacturonan acetylesterase